MELMQAIVTRRSVRDFTGESISEQQLEQIIRAGMNAPSAHNRQPWVFLSVTDKQKLLDMRPLSRWWKMLDNAAAAIVTLCDETSFRGAPPELQISGCCAATQNMLLAAHDIGLGAVWLGMCEGLPNYDKLKALLGIPAALRIVSVVAIGVSESPSDGRDYFDEQKWVKERF